MNTAISKTTYQYICQLRTTPEFRDLEAQYKTLKQFATHFGWTIQTFREYQRIKTELRERCKEAYNKNWEDRINQISENSKIARNFGIKSSF